MVLETGRSRSRSPPLSLESRKYYCKHLSGIHATEYLSLIMLYVACMLLQCHVTRDACHVLRVWCHVLRSMSRNTLYMARNTCITYHVLRAIWHVIHDKSHVLRVRWHVMCRGHVLREIQHVIRAWWPRNTCESGAKLLMVLCDMPGLHSPWKSN